MTIAYNNILSNRQMSHDRKIEQLNKWRVVYRKDPVNDLPTIDNKKYMFFKHGTYECYHLFNTKAKITTYKSLKWHMLVLYYLNNYEGLPINNLPRVFKFIADKENGFVTFFISQQKLQNMINEVLTQEVKPPKNKKRKVIFKDYNMLTLSDKLSIVGKLVGKTKISKEKIYDAMLELAVNHIKITYKRLSEICGVSIRTIHRRMGEELKKEKNNLNKDK
jgi:hypothetical protein